MTTAYQAGTRAASTALQHYPCRDLEHLVEQLVLVARTLDTDYETLKQRMDQPARKQPELDSRRSSDLAEQAS